MWNRSSPTYPLNSVYKWFFYKCLFGTAREMWGKPFIYYSTQQQAKHLEGATRTQTDSKTWFRYQTGCITASKFEAAAHTNKSSPSQSIESHPLPWNLQNNIRTYTVGLQAWKSFCNAYFSTSKGLHSSLKIVYCGLVLHPHYPHLCAPLAAQSPLSVVAVVYFKSNAHIHVVARHSMRRQIRKAFAYRRLETVVFTWSRAMILLSTAGPVKT